jgi:phosphoglucosamine mutase
MARQLFGTDGIRGVAGKPPLDPQTAFAFGCALGQWAREHDPNPEVLIGMDTRESGQWLAEHVGGGLKAQGVRPRFAGVITTPGVAYLTRTQHFVAGVMISASHNPFEDNGIKVFDHSGYKLPDSDEEALEGEIFRELAALVKPEPAPLEVESSLDDAYLASLVHSAPARLDGKHIVMDCANGAASDLAPALFRRLGAQVSAIGCDPNGRNINLDCGALHVEQLQQEVVKRGADFGVAFDGDADRAIFADAQGNRVDGDAVLLLTGRDWKRRGKLTNDLVVATVMSNLGLELALRREGITMLRTPVGDKYVLEEMRRREAEIGGEQSGHVIFREFATTGDGMLTAAQVFGIVARSGSTLADLTSDLETLPQLLVNVRVKNRKPLEQLALVNEHIKEAESQFAGSGRVLVRFSGTEPLARVMVEGPTHEAVEHHAHRIANAIQAELG